MIPDPLLALTFQHYAPETAGCTVVFPVDFPAVRTFRNDDSPEENLWAGRNLLYTLPILPLASFQHSASKYLIIAKDGNWLIEDLRAHRYPVHRLPIDPRADAIGGFTPLAHGKPFFFTALGDAAPAEPLQSDSTRNLFGWLTTCPIPKPSSQVRLHRSGRSSTTMIATRRLRIRKWHMFCCCVPW